jgi:hypothetical protein
LPVGNVTIFVNNNASSAAVDAWGNTFVSTSLTAVVTSDSTLPTLLSAVQVDASNIIDVTFSKAVTGASTAANYTLKDVSGATVALSANAAQQGSANTYRLHTVNTLATGGISTTSITFQLNTALSAINANKIHINNHNTTYPYPT